MERSCASASRRVKRSRCSIPTTCHLASRRGWLSSAQTRFSSIASTAPGVFEDVRITAQVIRGAGGAAIVRPDSHQRSLLIRYLNAGADGLMVPMVDTADQARAVVDAVRYACPADHEKRLVVSMIETLDAIGNIDDLLAVDGIDVFFIGPGDLSQNMGYPPAPAFGQPRPQAVIDRVGFAVDKIRAAGKVAGTLVTADELPYWLEKEVQFFYVHSDPFLRLGLHGIKKSLGR